MIDSTEPRPDAAPATGRGNSTIDAGPGALVVVVDDQSTGRRLLTQIIQGIGPRVEVATFADAASAIEFMAARPVDLILTDYLMPGMDGVGFIQRARALPGHTDVPIIVVTVVEDRDVRYRALDAGATDFLSRPVDEHECRARCRNLLMLRRQQHILRLRTQWLEQSERRFRTMADELALMISLVDASSGERFVNRSCRAFYGLSDIEFDNDCLERFLHPEDRDAYLAAYRAACDAREPFHGECRVRRADGEWRWLESYARPFFQPNGVFGGFVCASIDITDRKAAEQALRRSHRALAERGEQLARLASQLTLTEQRERRRLAKILHDDLQQLLVGASFGVDRVRRSLPDVAAIEKNEGVLGHVSEALSQAIEVSRGLVADLTPLILHEAGLAEALDWLARRMRDHFGLEVRLDIDTQVPPLDEDLRSITFDAVREALLNTAKHARCETATVSLRRLDEPFLELRIEDDGIGFDLAGTRVHTGKAGGFGLYAMTERLGAMGGLVEIDSSPGAGTRILLRVPLSREQTPVPADAASGASPDLPEADTSPSGATGGKVRILLVDDHVMIRHALASMLEGEPDLCVVGEAADGLEALREVERQAPDLVLMDFAMPRLDGLEATRRIKAHWPGVQVIGLSMYEEADRAEAMIAAGAEAYLSKTGDVETLLATLRGVAAGARG